MKTIIALFAILVFCSMTTSCKLQQPETESITVTSDPAVLEFNLETRIVDGRMVFVGRRAEIDGVVNPDLIVQAGRSVRLRITNQDGIPHDLFIADLGIQVALVSGTGATTEVDFSVSDNQVGTYAYFCTVSGHRQLGMEGKLIVVEP